MTTVLRFCCSSLSLVSTERPQGRPRGHGESLELLRINDRLGLGSGRNSITTDDSLGLPVGRGKLVGGPGLQKSDWISIDDLMHAESTRRSRNAEVLQNHTQKVYYLSKLAFGF